MPPLHHEFLASAEATGASAMLEGLNYARSLAHTLAYPCMPSALVFHARHTFVHRCSASVGLIRLFSN